MRFILWILVGIVVGISGYNLFNINHLIESNQSIEKKIEESQKSKSESSDKLDKKIEIIKKDIVKSVNESLDKQKSIDDKQNKTMNDNSNEISSINNKIDDDIIPDILSFDGKFASINSLITTNKDNVEELLKVNNNQMSVNDEFNNQFDEIKDELKKIGKQESSDNTNYQKQIDELKKDVIVNKEILNNDIDDVYKKFLSLSEDTFDLASQTVRLSEIVDDQDLIMKSSN